MDGGDEVLCCGFESTLTRGLHSLAADRSEKHRLAPRAAHLITPGLGIQGQMTLDARGVVIEDCR